MSYAADARFNETCDYADECSNRLNEFCNFATGRCACTSGAVYDIQLAHCRYLHCFETCTTRGYECHNGYCQLCWASNGQYLCAE